MKKILFILFAIPLSGFSQTDSSLAKFYKLNFAVPDFPAFKSLGTEPSNILRPSNVTDFGFVSSEFFNGRNLTIPSSFSAEICPVLLMNNGNFTLADLRKNSVWKMSRFSIGSTRDSLSTSKLSAGFRISIINKGDLRTDATGLKGLATILQEVSELKGKLATEYMVKNGLFAEDVAGDSSKMDSINEYVQKELDKIYEEKINKYKEEYQEKNWNAEKFDLAIATVGKSPDTLLGNVSYYSFSFWATYARPILKTKGQFLIGINYQNFIDDNLMMNSVNLSNRNYLGTNSIKGFIEEQIGYSSDDIGFNLLCNVGAEVYLSNGLWVDFWAGIDRSVTNNSSNFSSQFRFRYSLPN